MIKRIKGLFMTNSIIDDILRNFAPKVPRGRDPGEWTEDEYAADEILAQESREADWLEQQRTLEEEKEAAEPDFLLKPWTTAELEVEIARRRAAASVDPANP